MGSSPTDPIMRKKYASDLIGYINDETEERLTTSFNGCIHIFHGRVSVAIYPSGYVYWWIDNNTVQQLDRFGEILKDSTIISHENHLLQ